MDLREHSYPYLRDMLDDASASRVERIGRAVYAGGIWAVGRAQLLIERCSGDAAQSVDRRTQSEIDVGMRTLDEL
jgi:hypothetical protein